MTYELIICEKPKAAEKIAKALADGKAIKRNLEGIPYYDVTHGKKDIIVACAVGHLYGLTQKKKGWEYPEFEIEWKPIHETSKNSGRSRKFINVLKKLAKKAKEFTIATDYDVEGEVIGFNVLRFACKQKDAFRMKFSTLTKPDLIKAYEKKQKHINWGMAHAGETRHELDWYYGINLSRALTTSMKTAGIFKVLSSGRVQGPALKIIVDREKEIQKFVPEPFWQIELHGKTEESKKENLLAMHEADKFTDKKKADKVMANIKGKKKGDIKDVTAKKFKQNPPVPFDLTTMQIEAYRVFGIAPKDTLAIAQILYTDGLISYPRTSSQKLPKEIGYKKILTALSKQDGFKEVCNMLLALKVLKPNEGGKTDSAHPAIYPTGIVPKKLDGRAGKVYDLIVRRFFAVFGEPAVRETMTIKVDVNKEIFKARGTLTLEKNWHTLYGKYATFKEEELPKLKVGDKIDILKIDQLAKETQPPKRYTPASIIKELEKRNLGTKATRASILDALFQRNYVQGKSIEATALGIKIAEILQKYSPLILDENLTRSFEDEMEDIKEHKEKPKNVLDRARAVLIEILGDFKKKQKAVGKNLREAYIGTLEKENTVGKCPKCKEGKLKIITSRKTNKRFIACDKYPDCKTTFPIPQTGIIQPTEKECPDCKKFNLVQVKRGRIPQKVCINPECPSKKLDEKTAKEVKQIESGKVEKKCPKCGKDLVLRSSIYGKFFGCSGFPKCRYTEKIGEDKKKGDKKGNKTAAKKKVAKKAKKKTKKK